MIKWFLESKVLWALVHRFGGGYIRLIGPKDSDGFIPYLRLSYDEGPFEYSWYCREDGLCDYCTYEDAVGMIRLFIKHDGVRRIVFY